MFESENTVHECEQTHKNPMRNFNMKCAIQNQVSREHITPTHTYLIGKANINVESTGSVRLQTFENVLALHQTGVARRPTTKLSKLWRCRKRSRSPRSKASGPMVCSLYCILIEVFRFVMFGSFFLFIFPAKSDFFFHFELRLWSSLVSFTLRGRRGVTSTPFIVFIGRQSCGPHAL